MKRLRYANSPGGSIRRRSLRLECPGWRGHGRRVPVCLLTRFLPAGVFAMMAPNVYQQARDTAMYHVQVKVRNVTGNCDVTGEVVRIFRDPTGTLTKGAPLTFTVSCHKPGNPVTVGGALWTDYDSLMKAK